MGDIVVLHYKTTKTAFILMCLYVVLISFTLRTIVSNLFDFYGFVLYNKINIMYLGGVLWKP